MKKSSFYRSTNRKMFLIFFLPVIILVIIVDYGFTKQWKQEEIDYYCQIMDIGIERVEVHLKNGDTTMARELLERYMFVSDSENMFYDKDGNFIVGHQVPEYVKNIKDIKPDEFVLKKNKGHYYVILAHQSSTSGSYMVVCSSAEPLLRYLYFQYLLMLLGGGLAVGLSMFLYHKWLRPKIKKMIMANERMETELEIAHHVQQYMVPTNEKLIEGDHLSIFGCLKPAREVGGDLFDYLLVKKNDENGKPTNYLYFCIGDISDKGTPAALLMAVSIGIFDQLASLRLPLSQVVSKMNDMLINDNRNDMFCTLFAGSLNLDTGMLEFVNAGHDQPVLNGTFMTPKHNRPLGVTANYDYQSEFIQLKKDDVLFLYTDGITEAKTNDNQFFGNQRLLSVLNSQGVDNAQQISENALNEVNKFVGDAEQFDDITILCIRMLK